MRRSDVAETSRLIGPPSTKPESSGGHERLQWHYSTQSSNFVTNSVSVSYAVCMWVCGHKQSRLSVCQMLGRYSQTRFFQVLSSRAPNSKISKKEHNSFCKAKKSTEQWRIQIGLELNYLETFPVWHNDKFSSSFCCSIRIGRLHLGTFGIAAL